MLNFKLIDIPFVGGIDKKSADVSVIPTKVVSMDNAVFSAAGEISKRDGTSAVPMTAVGGSSAMTSAVRLSKWRDRLLVEGGGSLYASNDLGLYQTRADPLLSDSTAIGSFRRFARAAVEDRPWVTPDDAFTAYDVARGTTTRAVVWSTSIGDVRYTVEDIATGVTVFRGTIFDTAGVVTYSDSRVVWNANTAGYVLYYRRTSGGATSLRCRSLSTSLGAEQTMISPFVGEYDVDFSSAGGIRGFAHADNGAATVYTAQLTTDGLNILALHITNPIAGLAYVTVVANDVDDHIVSIYTTNSTSITATSVDVAAAPIAVAVVVATAEGAAASVRRLAAAFDAVTTEIHLIYENTDLAAYPATDEVLLRLATFDNALTTTIEGRVCGSLELAGRPAFVTANGVRSLVLPAAYKSTVQPTVYLLDITDYPKFATAVSVAPPVIARMAAGEARTSVLKALPRLHVSDATVHMTYTRWERALRYEAGTNITIVSLRDAQINLTAQLGDVEANGVTYLAGACPHVYDGMRVVEEGFHTAPVINSISAAGAGAGTGGGSYSVVAVYEHTDAAGNVWQSGPSLPAAVTTVAGNFITVGVSSLRLTQRARARVVLYRTTLAGLVYYREASVLNDPDNNNVSGVLGAPTDAALSGGSAFGRTGTYDAGYLATTAAPHHRTIAVHQNRLFVASEDRVFYTREREPGYAFEFVDTFDFPIPTEHGRICALASQDGHLAIVCERAVLIVFGEGPNALGAGNGYSAPQHIAAEGGVYDSPKGVVVSDVGIWLVSARGVRLIGRNNALVMGPNGLPAGSELDPVAKAQPGMLMFRLRDDSRVYVRVGDDLYVYDSDYGQWSRFTGLIGVDTVGIGGAFYVLRSTPDILKSDSASYTDAGTAITMNVRTAFVRLGALQGYQRVREVYVLGSSNSTSAITVAVKPGYTAADSTPAAGSLTSTARQLRHTPAIQKCEAMQFAVVSADSTRPTLNGLTLDVGFKRGGAKLPSTKHF